VSVRQQGVDVQKGVFVVHEAYKDVQCSLRDMEFDFFPIRFLNSGIMNLQEAPLDELESNSTFSNRASATAYVTGLLIYHFEKNQLPVLAKCFEQYERWRFGPRE
jgi:hypothetical protein